MKKYNLIIFVLVTAAALMFYSCERPTEPANPNQPPNTSMANIPNTSDTLFALVTLHWDGEDFDGYIDGFEYRYITIRVFIGDTVVHDWEFTKETSLTIPFQSDDDLNQQIFQVRSVDNLGAVDPEPAEKVFYTVKTIFPESHILYPVNEETYFVIDEPTDWWEGIRLDFVAYDRDGEIVEYAWSVDDGELHWTEDTTVVIKPEEFKAPLTGEHTIKVVSRDNTNLIDPVGNTVKINLVRPSLEKRILIIDATNEANFPAGLVNKANDAKVDTFYSTVYEGSDQWDFIKNGMPPVEVLGQYRLVVWHSDDLPFTQPHQISRYTEQIKDYMNVGGNIIIGGWRILKSFAWLDNFPKTFEPGTFVNDYLHIVSVDETSLIGDFTGGAGLEGVYSNIRVDSAKAAGFPYNGMLGNINMILLPAGFTDGIYFYQNKNNSPYFEYRGRTVGLRYYGTTFQSVVLGFPMYFIREDDAKQMINEILAQMGI
jgi:hypothetical protein